MFGWIKNAARAVVGFAKSAASTVARTAVKGWRWLARTAKPALLAVPLGIRYLFRGVTWGWMSLIELYSLTEAPFFWAFTNIIYGTLRGAENVWNWVRGTNGIILHQMFPPMSFATANATNMVAFYPFFVFPAWLFSPITGKAWYANLVTEYQARALHLADDAYVSRFRRSMWFWAKPTVVAAETVMTAAPKQREPWGGLFKKTTVKEEAPAEVKEPVAAGYDGPPPPPGYEEVDYRRSDEEQEPMTLEQEQAWLRQRGLVMVTAQPGINPSWPSAYDYLEPYREAEVGARDIGGNRWEALKIGAPTSYEQMLEMTQSDPTEAVVRPEDVDESWKQVSDPKRKSYTYGMSWALASIEKMPGFLTDPELQKKSKALLNKQVKSATSGFTVKSTMEGFDSIIKSHTEANNGASV